MTKQTLITDTGALKGKHITSNSSNQSIIYSRLIYSNKTKLIQQCSLIRISQATLSCHQYYMTNPKVNTQAVKANTKSLSPMPLPTIKFAKANKNLGPDAPRTALGEGVQIHLVSAQAFIDQGQIRQLVFKKARRRRACILHVSFVRFTFSVKKNDWNKTYFSD